LSDAKHVIRKTAKPPPVPVGEVWDLRCHTDIMIGPKQLSPNANAVHGELGWSIVVDDELDCVWVGYQGWWTRVGWDSIRYVRYRKADEVKA
jgi:hypothetical protein